MLNLKSPQRLGHCAKCQGSLCMSGPDVICSVCSLPAPAHVFVECTGPHTDSGQPAISQKPAGRRCKACDVLEQHHLPAEIVQRPKDKGNPRGGEVPGYKTVPTEQAVTWIDRIKTLEGRQAAMAQDLAAIRSLLEEQNKRRK